jgi:hypothetical protein
VWVNEVDLSIFIWPFFNNIYFRGQRCNGDFYLKKSGIYGEINEKHTRVNYVLVSYSVLCFFV